MTTMVEKVAEAIRKAERSSSNIRFFLTVARAAIEAMREPTDEMLAAAARQSEQASGDRLDPSQTWPTMISAALDEK